MSTVGTFLLVVAAFVGTVLFFINPAGKFQEWSRGKKISDLKAELEVKIEEDSSNVVLGCCGLVLFVIVALAYTFIVEPLAVIAALVNKIGYMPVAYAMLVIVAISWIRTARIFLPSGKTKTLPEGTMVEIDEELKFSNPLWNAIKRFFFFLPSLYLWYLFLVVIDVL